MNGRCIRRTRRLRLPIASFSHAVRTGPYVFVGAKGSLSARTRGVIGRGDLERQADRVLQNLATALEELESGLDRVSELRLWVEDPRAAASALAVARARAPDAAVAVRSSGSFPIPGFLLEADAIAVDSGVARAVNAMPAGLSATRAGELTVLEGPIPGSPDGVAWDADAAVEHCLAAIRAACGDEDLLLVLDVRLDHLARADAFAAAWRGQSGAPAVAMTVAPSTTPTTVGTVRAVIAASAVARHAAADGTAFATRSGSWVVAGSTGSAATDGEAGAVTRLARALDEAGARIDDVLHVTATVPGWLAYRAFDAAYASRFAPPFPARTTIQAQLPDASAAIQLLAIARTGMPIDYLTS